MPAEHHGSVAVALKYIVSALYCGAVIENVERVSLYLPEELKVRLETRAGKNRRSLNSEIIIMLERMLETEEVYKEK